VPDFTILDLTPMNAKEILRVESPSSGHHCFWLAAVLSSMGVGGPLGEIRAFVELLE